MKINNKGFAITSIIYSMLILFLTLVVLILGNLANRKVVFDNQKKEIVEKFHPSSIYQQVEYIQSKGAQYIDTGVHSKSTIGFESEFKIDAGGNEDGVFSVSAPNAQAPHSVLQVFGTTLGLWIKNPGIVYTLWNDKNYHKLSVNVKKGENKLYVDDVLKSTDKGAETNEGFPTIEYSFYLFARNTGGVLMSNNSGPTTGYFTMKYFKIYDDGELIRDFVPCYRKPANEVGLYDLVEGKFYTNMGTDSFVAGPEV